MGVSVRDELNTTSQSALIELPIARLLCHYTCLSVTLLVYVLLIPAWAIAEPVTESDEYIIKAAFLYKFSKFIKWPSKQDSETSASTFDICILGTNYFGVATETLAEKTTGGAQVVVSYIDSIPFFNDCHILFISKSETKRLGDILQSVANQPVLTVSDIDGFVSNGGCIEFVTQDDKTDFNINSRAAEHSQLKFSAQLLELDKVVVTK
jgi:hypothetical protein